jgi:hypothetical protein
VTHAGGGRNKTKSTVSHGAVKATKSGARMPSQRQDKITENRLGKLFGLSHLKFKQLGPEFREGCKEAYPVCEGQIK